MGLGQVLTQAAAKDLAHKGVNGLMYSELSVGGKFEIRLTSSKSPEAFIECSVPNKGKEEDENYLRMYFLSMVMNAAIHGMKRLNTNKKKNKKKP